MGRVPWLLLPVCAVLPPPIRNSPAHSTELLPEQHLILQLLRALGKAMEKKRDKGLGQVAPLALLRSLQSLQVSPRC